METTGSCNVAAIGKDSVSDAELANDLFRRAPASSCGHDESSLPPRRGDNKSSLITNEPKIWGQANFARRAKHSGNSDAEVLATILERAFIRFNRLAVC